MHINNVIILKFNKLESVQLYVSPYIPIKNIYSEKNILYFFCYNGNKYIKLKKAF